MTAYRIKPSHSRLNRAHSLANGLLLEIPFFGPDGSALDFSGNSRHGTLSGSAVWARGTQGRRVSHAAVTDHISFGDSSFLPTDRVTLVLGYEKSDTTNRQSFGFNVNSTTLAHRIAASLPWSDGVVYFDFGSNGGNGRISASGLSFGNDLWVFRYGPHHGRAIWQNGVRRASATGSITRTSTTSDFRVGAGAGFNGDLAGCWLLRVYGRELSDTEILQTTLDPWILYDDEDESDWIGALAQGSAGITQPYYYRQLLAGSVG